MHENRCFFRADVTLKYLCRPIDIDSRQQWLENIELGVHEDLCRYYLSGEEQFLKKIDKLTPDKDDLKGIFLFINEKMNHLLQNSQEMKDHPLLNLKSQTINLGGGGCAIIDENPYKKEALVLLEFLLPSNNYYIRTLAKCVYSKQEGDRWRSGFVFDKISTQSQDDLMGFIFQCQRLDSSVSDKPHHRTEDSSPYN